MNGLRGLLTRKTLPFSHIPPSLSRLPSSSSSLSSLSPSPSPSSSLSSLRFKSVQKSPLSLSPLSPPSRSFSSFSPLLSSSPFLPSYSFLSFLTPETTQKRRKSEIRGKFQMEEKEINLFPLSEIYLFGEERDDEIHVQEREKNESHQEGERREEEEEEPREGRWKGKKAGVHGWVRAVRRMKDCLFLELNDGSSFDFQVVVDTTITDEEKNEEKKGEEKQKMWNEIAIGCSVVAYGTLIRPPNYSPPPLSPSPSPFLSPSPSSSSKKHKQKHKIEMTDTEIVLIGKADKYSYPLLSRRPSFDYLRGYPHLRPRAPIFGAVARIRNSTEMALHQYLQKEGFLHIQTPVLTPCDCEGGGEQFLVDVPPNYEEKNEEGEKENKEGEKENKEGEKENEEGEIKERGEGKDKSFFGNPTYLTVSGQLDLEIFSNALSRVYSFGPTFRAEKSNTLHHVSEFWMLEPEMPYANLPTLLDLCEGLIKAAVQGTLQNNLSDLSLTRSFGNNTNTSSIELLQHVVTSPFVRITYTEFLALLEGIQKEKTVRYDLPLHSESNWTLPDEERWGEIVKAGKRLSRRKWGDSLPKEHEKFLCEVLFDRTPVFVSHYPEETKPFYMKRDEEVLFSKGEGERRTVACMDLLMPGIGEVVGGSVREEKEEVLKERMMQMGMTIDEYKWYLDLRKYGSVPHGGFGVGFDRLIQFVSAVGNIRDVIPLPRYYRHCSF